MAEDFNKIIFDVEVNAPDTSNLKEAKKDIKEVGDETKKLGNNDPGKPFVSLKAQLRQARNELGEMIARFGDTSKEAAKAAEKVALIKDHIDQANIISKQFNPDLKFKSLGIVATTAGTAIQGVGGALAVLGVDSQNAMEVMAKLQGVMAFTGALNEIDDLVDKWKGYALSLDAAKKAQDAKKASELQEAAAVTVNTEATAGNTVAQGENAVAVGVSTAATEAQTVATNVATAASRTFNLVLKSMIPLAVIAGVITLVTWLVKLATAETEAEKTAKLVNQVHEEAASIYAKELIHVQSLVSEYNKKNTSHERQVEIIKDLQKQYPAYFNSLNAEKTKIQDLQKAYDLLVTSIKAKATAEGAGKVLEKEAEDFAKNQADYLSKRQETVNKFNEDLAKLAKTDAKDAAYQKSLFDARMKEKDDEFANKYEKPFKQRVDAINQVVTKANQDIKDVDEKALALIPGGKAAKARLKTIDDEIELMQAKGKDSYKLEKEKYQNELVLAGNNQEERGKINHKIEVLEAEHQKKLADASKSGGKELQKEQNRQLDDLRRYNELLKEVHDEREKLQGEPSAIRKEKDESAKQLEEDFKNTEKARTEELKTLNLSNKSKEEKAKEKLAIDQKYGKIAEDFKEINNQRLLNIDKKYAEDADNFLLQHSNDDLEKKIAQIHKDYEEMLKNTLQDPNRHALIQARLDEEINQARKEDTAHNVTIKAETQYTQTQMNNVIYSEDTSNVALQKADAVNEALKVKQEAAYEEQKVLAKDNQEELGKIESDYNNTRLQNLIDFNNQVLNIVQNHPGSVKQYRKDVEADYNLLEDKENNYFNNKLIKLQQDYNDGLLTKQQYDKAIEDAEQAHVDNMNAIDDGRKEAKKKIDEEALGNAKDYADKAAMLGEAVDEIAGKSTAFGKATAIAKTTIDTIENANHLFKEGSKLAPPPAGLAIGAAFAAVGIAQGMARVKKIMEVKVPGKNGSSSSASATPSIPNISATSVVQAPQDVRVTNPKDTVVKTYVTQSDLLTAQQKDNFLKSING